MSIQLGVVMDPIASIHFYKDSTLAMLLAAKANGMTLYYLEQQDLFLRDGIPYGDVRPLQVWDDAAHWFQLGERKTIPLSMLDVILMRKDPPFDECFIYTTYLLEYAERLGVMIVNRPQSLRDANEKIFATYFPSYTPPTIVTSSIEKLTHFWREQGDMVCKPLNSMGGSSVFRLPLHEVNANVILTTLTANGQVPIMAQRYIPEIVAGDKRILLINGEPIPYALARVPQSNDWRGNLAAGAKGVVQPLSLRDQAICEVVGPVLRERGLYFVGIDVIGDYLTEVNVTSPTGIREITKHTSIDVAQALISFIEQFVSR